jgi:hypothetical protein
VSLRREYAWWMFVVLALTGCAADRDADAAPVSSSLGPMLSSASPLLSRAHQHLAAIDDSQGPINVERRFSALVGLPLARLTNYPGSVTGWQDSMFGPTAFVVELPAGQLAPGSAQRYVDAIETVETLN